MLIEHSFHTNTAATKWLSVDANLDKLAVAEAELLADYFGVKDTPKTEIMGEAQATAQQMALFCRSKNAEPKLTSCTLEQLAEIFLEEGKAEAFAETSPSPEPPRDRLLQVRRHRPPEPKQLRGHRSSERERHGTGCYLP